MISRVRTSAALASAAAGLVAALVYGFEVLARVFDIADGRVRWQIPVGAAGLIGLAQLLAPESWRRLPAVVGWVGPAIAVVVAATGAASGSGIGRLQIEVIVAGLVAVPLVRLAVLPAVERFVGTATERAAAVVAIPTAAWVGLGVVVAAAIVAWTLLLGTPLGHDESVYALKARSWRDGTPDTGFGIYRPIGMPLVGWLVLGFSDSESAFRLFGLAGLLLLAITTWWFARRLYGAGAATLAAAVLIVAPSVLRRTPEFLNDLFIAGLLLAIAFLLWRHLEGGEPDRLLLWIGPLGVLTFYLRYGALAGLAGVAIAAVIIWPARVWASRRLFLAVAALFGAGLAPHVVYSLAETGSVTGVVDAAADVAGRNYIGEGLVDYIAWAPSRLAGPLAAVLGGLGLAWYLTAALRRRRGREVRGALFLLAAASIQVLALGLISHAEERFVFSAIAMVLIAGSGAVVAVVQRLKPATAGAVLAATALAVAASFVVSIDRVDRQLSGVATSRAILLDVSDFVAAGPASDCVVLTSSVPEITWYSRCATYRLDNGWGRELVQRAEDGYIVIFDNAKDDELRVSVDDLIDQSGEPTFLPSIGGSVGDARIWKVS